MDEEWPDHFDEHGRPSRTRIEEEGDRKHDAMANMVARPQSLQDYLHDQLGYFDLEPGVREMADRIIYNLDANGYLQGNWKTCSVPDAGAEQLALAQRALAVVQRLDPPGVAARDLKECLLLQLTPGMPYYEQLRTLISGHLEDIEHNRLPVVARHTGYSIELIQQTIHELRKLNPKPGADFGDASVPPVTPDVFVEPAEAGGYRVRLEDGRTPSLFISPYYRKLLCQRRDQRRNPRIHQAEDQRGPMADRFDRAAPQHADARGPGDRRPSERIPQQGPRVHRALKMQQIADKVGVHVTTVSRAVDDKWIQTPRGIFPLKRFFCGGTVTDGGEEVAWDAVRMKLQEIVDGERPATPLQRRRAGQGAGQARHQGRPAHGDQVSQGDEYSQFAAAPRLDQGRGRSGQAGHRASQWRGRHHCEDGKGEE